MSDDSKHDFKDEPSYRIRFESRWGRIIIAREPDSSCFVTRPVENHSDIGMVTFYDKKGCDENEEPRTVARDDARLINELNILVYAALQKAGVTPKLDDSPFHSPNNHDEVCREATDTIVSLHCDNNRLKAENESLLKQLQCLRAQSKEIEHLRYFVTKYFASFEGFYE